MAKKNNNEQKKGLLGKIAGAFQGNTHSPEPPKKVESQPEQEKQTAKSIDLNPEVIVARAKIAKSKSFGAILAARQEERKAKFNARKAKD
jgi:hypothetical protein